VPILIQVPNLRASARRSSPARRRRRLRKEVRVAGLTMMSVLPVGFLLLALGGAQPAPRSVKAAAPAPAPVAPARTVEANRDASVSLADAPIASVAAAPVPVVFHDYLLPVDGPEEPDHAGR
jgi:hypothetical protein